MLDNIKTWAKEHETQIKTAAMFFFIQSVFFYFAIFTFSFMERIGDNYV